MDVSAVEVNTDADEATSTADVAKALSSLPTSNGALGLASGDNKFQSAILAWRSMFDQEIIVVHSYALQISI